MVVILPEVDAASERVQYVANRNIDSIIHKERIMAYKGVRSEEGSIRGVDVEDQLT